MKIFKLKVVIDTNIFVSSAFGGNPQKIVRLLLEDHIINLIYKPIFFEIEKNMLKVLKEPALSFFLEEIMKASIKINPITTFNAIPDDPSDNKFLECAVAGKADFIVSGDKHLLKLKSFRKIPILTPRQFLDGFLK